MIVSRTEQFIDNTRKKLKEVININVSISVGSVPVKGLPSWPTKFHYLIWVGERCIEVFALLLLTKLCICLLFLLYLRVSLKFKA